MWTAKLALAFATLSLTSALPAASPPPAASPKKNICINTDVYNDAGDIGVLLVAATSPQVNLLAVNVDSGSDYSALATSAVLAYYNHSHVPIGVNRPSTNKTFYDDITYDLGEYASKVAYNYKSDKQFLKWPNGAASAPDPVALYRKELSKQPDKSVTIVSIGLFVILSGLLNSTADAYSHLTGPELIRAKVAELVVMGGDYPRGHEYNFYSDRPMFTAQVINTWKDLTPIAYVGDTLGNDVLSGLDLQLHGPDKDPVKAGYRCWDTLTLLYAIGGRGKLFKYGNTDGYNHVFANGSNVWVHDKRYTNQHWLELKDGTTPKEAGAEVDRLLMAGAVGAAHAHNHSASATD
ncbi:inosine/uridine-preferring nucleoside hydrolase [Mycena rebaudengoi]|nr:inosine/uridine-preferring nucleoside hydrolase [Mycena rebaudengoi]